MQADFAPPADQGPHHLAQTVLRALSVSMPEPPPEDLLLYFFSALYEASFRSDQGAPLRGRIIWQAPGNDLDDSSEHLRLTPPVPFSAGSLSAFLARTQPPPSSLLVSEGEAHPLVIHAIAPSRGEPPTRCVFQADILGPAHLKVTAGLDYPIELRRSRLHLSTQNVFGRGPVRARLASLLEMLYPALLPLLPAEIAGSPLLAAGSFPLPGGGVLLQEQQDWPETLTQFWLDAWILLLGRLGETQRGGLVLLTPRRDRSAREEGWLARPQGAVYPQLRRLLEQRAAAAMIRQTEAAEALTAAPHQPPPDALLLQETSLAADVLTRDGAITDTLQFLASLACGDGPLCLTPQLELLSFGGQPSLHTLPERVYLAADETASELTPISSRSFGPRNQALLSLCHQDPDAIGLAFTQDGDLRAMLRQGDKLIVWNTVNLPRL